MDDQLLSEFLAEAEDLIAALYADLSALRGRGADGRARRELVGRVFRRVHTLKGSAAAAGVESVGALAHEFESLLEAVRMGRVALAEDVLVAAEEAVDALSAGLSAAARGGRADAPRELSERLRRLSEAGGTAAGRGEDEEHLLPREVARLLGAYELQRAREAAREGARLFVVTVSFGLEDFDEQFRRLSEALGVRGEVVSTLPVVSGEEPERVGFRVVYATGEGREQVAAVIGPFGATLLEDGKGGSDEVEDEASGAGESATRADGAAGGALPQSAAPLTMQVRVPLEVLDDLISSAHELFN